MIVETPTAIHLSWRTESDTAAFAARMAQPPLLQNAFIELRGDLGAGKTAFARHLLHAMGVVGTIKSPTYTVVEPYETPAGLHIWHFDFYRFADPHEWEDAGLRDLFAAPGLKLVEWPERAASRLPTPDLILHLSVASASARDVSLQAPTRTGTQILQQLIP